MKIKYLLPMMGLFCLLFPDRAMTQEIDTSLMNVVLETLINHKEVAPYVNTLTRGDAAAGCEKFKDKLRNLEIIQEKDQGSSVPMFMVNNRYDYWTAPIKKMKPIRGYILKRKTFELYYANGAGLWYTSTPIVIMIDSVSLSKNTCFLQLRTVKTAWFSFPMKNPPTHFYAFTMKFVKRKKDWVLADASRKQLEPYWQNLKQ